MRARLFGIALGLITPFHASAEQEQPVLPPEKILSVVMRPGTSLDAIVAPIRQTFLMLDANLDGRLDERDAELHTSIATARQRASTANAFMISDLDGDGAVTEQEFMFRHRYEMRSANNTYGVSTDAMTLNLGAKFKEADTNRDGRISWAEAAVDRSNRSGSDYGGLQNDIRSLLTFAGPKTKSIPERDYIGFAIAAFQLIDTDQNGVIATTEIAKIQSHLAEQRRREAMEMAARRADAARAECVMPKASSATKVVLLSSYEAGATSSSTLGSQDVSIGVTSVVIEPGPEPLYVVALSHRGSIWRFVGATERLERVVIGAASTGPNSGGPGKPLAGATGVPADKIMFMPRPDCLKGFSDSPSTQASTTAAIVRKETGRDPVIAAGYKITTYWLPSGDGKVMTNTVNREPSPRMVGGAIEFGEGVVQVDPKSVVSQHSVSRYEVLPGEYGLAQLLQRGALSQTKGNEYLIREKIRFPAELFGGRSARFLLLKGVPEPDGNPGHSCVISEETGAPLARWGRQATCN